MSNDYKFIYIFATAKPSEISPSEPLREEDPYLIRRHTFDARSLDHHQIITKPLSYSPTPSEGELFELGGYEAIVTKVEESEGDQPNVIYAENRSFPDHSAAKSEFTKARNALTKVIAQMFSSPQSSETSKQQS